MLSSVLEHEKKVERLALKARKNKKVDHSDAEDVIAMKASKGLLILP